MSRLARIVAAFCFATALAAPAQDVPSAIPEGFVKIETAGKFVIHARTAKSIGPVAKAALSKNLRDLFKEIGEDMNIRDASLSCAPGSALWFKPKQRRGISRGDEQRFDSWRAAHLDR